ncbi:MAG: type II toxin-antitoxin system PemK/MazF family toxin [Chloroflexi bacterium]|nr:type II toxin-antitoxin system PemK/MazF family toxin [Chloroflexota bacterium]
MRAAQPSRGEVWLVDLSPTRGHEQAGVRPALVVSADLFNHGPAGLIVVVPLTTRAREIPLHVAVTPPEGGPREPSFVKCEDIRSVSRGRLTQRWGAVGERTLAEVEDRLRVLLEL